MQRIFLFSARVGAGLLGLISLVSGGKAIAHGLSGLSPAESLTAAPELFAILDNDYRFFAATWMSVGIALLYSAIKIRTVQPVLFHIALLGVFLGGIARMVGMLSLGPIPKYYAATVIELVLPIVIVIFHNISRQPKTTNATSKV